jgi:ribose/xylose/arabinose/galactoside ABC-type transport system permease subunit
LPGGRNSLSRHLFRLAGILAVLLIASVAFAWLRGGDEASLNPIAQAAVRTQELPGGRTSFHTTVCDATPMVRAKLGLDSSS